MYIKEIRMELGHKKRIEQQIRKRDPLQIKTLKNQILVIVKSMEVIVSNS